MKAPFPYSLILGASLLALFGSACGTEVGNGRSSPPQAAGGGVKEDSEGDESSDSPESGAPDNAAPDPVDEEEGSGAFDRRLFLPCASPMAEIKEGEYTGSNGGDLSVTTQGGGFLITTGRYQLTTKAAPTDDEPYAVEVSPEELQGTLSCDSTSVVTSGGKTQRRVTLSDGSQLRWTLGTDNKTESIQVRSSSGSVLQTWTLQD